MPVFEKIDRAGNAVKTKIINRLATFDASGDKGRWLPVERTVPPPHDPSTERLVVQRSVLADKISYSYRTVALSADEQRDVVDATEDLVEALIAKGLIAKQDLRSRYGDQHV